MSGLFSVRWEDAHGRRSVEGPNRVPVDTAVAWARERARVVIVWVGTHDGYSAGEEHPSDVAARWPAEGIDVEPRPLGEPPTGGRQVVEWAGRISIAGRGDAARERATAVARDLAGLADVQAPRVVEPSSGTYEVRCTISARGTREAALRLDALVAGRTGDGEARTGLVPVVEISGRA